MTVGANYTPAFFIHIPKLHTPTGAHTHTFPHCIYHYYHHLVDDLHHCPHCRTHTLGWTFGRPTHHHTACYHHRCHLFCLPTTTLPPHFIATSPPRGRDGRTPWALRFVALYLPRDTAVRLRLAGRLSLALSRHLVAAQRSRRVFLRCPARYLHAGGRCGTFARLHRTADAPSH